MFRVLGLHVVILSAFALVGACTSSAGSDDQKQPLSTDDAATADAAASDVGTADADDSAPNDAGGDSARAVNLPGCTLLAPGSDPVAPCEGRAANNEWLCPASLNSVDYTALGCGSTGELIAEDAGEFALCCP